MTQDTWREWRGRSEPLLFSPLPNTQHLTPNTARKGLPNTEFRRRQAPERLVGRWDRACFAAWQRYCHVQGVSPHDHGRMRGDLARIVRRPLRSRTELTMGEWRRCAEALGERASRRDGGFHDALFGHCPELQPDRRLWAAVYGALCGFAEPCELAGAERETWVALLALLQEHRAQGCAGGEACALLREAERVLEDERRAA